MSHTTTPTEAMRQLVASARQQLAPISEEHEAVLLFAAERGILNVENVTCYDLEHHQLANLLQVTGAWQAWEADQEARSVPLDCPAWCEGLHGAATSVTPFYALESHECTLARSEHLAVSYVLEQAHPESAMPARPAFVSVYIPENPSLEFDPADLPAVADEYAQTMQRAAARLATLL